MSVPLKLLVVALLIISVLLVAFIRYAFNAFKENRKLAGYFNLFWAAVAIAIGAYGCYQFNQDPEALGRYNQPDQYPSIPAPR